MSDRQFVGAGWEHKYGVNIKIKKAEIEALPVNEWGEVALVVNKLKEQSPKSKATHYVAVDNYAGPTKPKLADDKQDGPDLPF